MKNFEVQAVVVCDDVRKESSNKDLLIGVYPDGLGLVAIPATIMLAFWVQLIPTKSLKTAEIHLQVELPNDVMGPQAKFQMAEVQKNRSFALPMRQMAYPIVNFGMLKLKIKEGESGAWVDIKEFRIEHQAIRPISG